MSGPSAPVFESRRPPMARLIGFAALLIAVSWGLGAFAAWPWMGSGTGAAMIRVAFKHVAAFEHEGGPALSKEDLEKLPRHMRPTSPERSRTGRRVDTLLSVEVDGRLLLQKHYVPGGFRHDGPTFGYEELSLPAGRHHLEVTLADARAELAQDEAHRRWRLAQDVDLSGGQALLIEFSEETGLSIRYPPPPRRAPCLRPSRGVCSRRAELPVQRTRAVSPSAQGQPRRAGAGPPAPAAFEILSLAKEQFGPVNGYQACICSWRRTSRLSGPAGSEFVT